MKSTILQTAIPVEKGPAEHYERQDDYAATQFRGGKVAAIHTPESALKRVHEVMHARHSDPNGNAYPGIRYMVEQLIEDCRLHIRHWPWSQGQTPDVIADDTIAVLDREIASLTDPKLASEHTPFADFALRLRAKAIMEGSLGRKRPSRYYATNAMEDTMYEVCKLLATDRALEAAKMVEAVFFYDEDREKEKKTKPPEEPKLRPMPTSSGIAMKFEGEHRTEALERLESLGEGHHKPTMDIIELPLVEPTTHASIGNRLATSGPRLHRPALRKPIIGPKLFIKHTPLEPGGAVLFDASSSMSVNEATLLDCCRRAPKAAIAYYAGQDGGTKGWLYVFARDGLRARAIMPPASVGNAVDRQAMDWLMDQDGPRIFVTDRELCGAYDSLIQQARLAVLEELGEITVYTSYTAFQEKFPVANT